MKYRTQMTLGLLVVFLVGCASKAPSIAHTHIGHALTGWHDTPEKEGLFIVAEDKINETIHYTHTVTRGGLELTQLQSYADKILLATDPQFNLPASTDIHAPYGTKQALLGALDHITFAATSKDASGNLKDFSGDFAKNASGVLERSDLIVALSQDVINADSTEVATELMAVIAELAHENLHGKDNNGNNSFKDSPEEYGITQLREDLQAMLDREDPPYTTVDSWYLFNLIKLPSGIWVFKDTSKGTHSHRY